MVEVFSGSGRITWDLVEKGWERANRHRKSSETVVCLRGHLREVFCNDCVAFNIPLGQWHSVEVLESGTVILECKEGAYEALGEEDI